MFFLTKIKKRGGDIKFQSLAAIADGMVHLLTESKTISTLPKYIENNISQQLNTK